jgi:ethanolamine ammonia-lyase small subunit
MTDVVYSAAFAKLAAKQTEQKASADITAALTDALVQTEAPVEDETTEKPKRSTKAKVVD